MARIIAVCNQKGGVGKTTTALNLAAALTEHNSHVLLVDSDPRADLSTYLGVNLAQEQPSVYQALFSDDIAMADVIVPTHYSGLSLAPANTDLAGAEMLFMQRKGPDRYAVISQACASVSGNYDYVIIDTPPGLQMLNIASLVAAHEVIVPQQCSFIALHGLQQLQQNIEHLTKQLNPALTICGILMTMQDRRTIHNRQVIEMVRDGFGDIVFATVIPTTVRIQEAAAAGQPITIYDEHSTAAAAYRDLAKEVISRG